MNTRYVYDPNCLSEKRDIRRRSNSVACTLILCEILATLLSLGITLLLPAFGVNVQSLSDDLIYSEILNACIMSIAMTLPFCFMVFLLKNKSEITPVFSKPRTDPSTTVYYCLFAILLTYVAGAFTSLISSFFEIFAGVEPYTPQLGEKYSDPVSAFIVSIICSCLLPAMCEEFAFRGIIFGTLRRFGDRSAIIVSALLFGLLHGNFVQLPYTFVMGVGLAYITVRTGSIYPAMIVHFTNNTLATVNEWLPDFAGVLSLVLLGLSVFAAVMLSRRRALIKSPDAPSYFSGAQRTRMILLSPIIIIYAVLQILTSVYYLR